MDDTRRRRPVGAPLLPRLPAAAMGAAAAPRPGALAHRSDARGGTGEGPALRRPLRPRVLVRLDPVDLLRRDAFRGAERRHGRRLPRGLGPDPRASAGRRRVGDGRRRPLRIGAASGDLPDPLDGLRARPFLPPRRLSLEPDRPRALPAPALAADRRALGSLRCRGPGHGDLEPPRGGRPPAAGPSGARRRRARAGGGRRGRPPPRALRGERNGRQAARSPSRSCSPTSARRLACTEGTARPTGRSWTRPSGPPRTHRS